ncbi:hypothetical protein [Nonomuraea sp. LPB2021202275-12-8]|uniref:hypothetical protein n=1 Tax=Nonomuraea sp. LPB2021202275-12-8 TaxID=3120159 RepID=UPI00300D5F90
MQETTTEQLCGVYGCGADKGPFRAYVGILCLGHISRLRRDVAVTPLLMRWLGMHTAASGGGHAEPVSGSRERGTPLRLDVMSMILPGAVHPVDDEDQAGPASIPSTLAAWAWQVAEERGLAGPSRWDDVSELSEWLARHLDYSAHRPWASQMCEDLAGLRRAAHGLVPWKVHRAEKDGIPCPSCDLMSLVQVSGEPYIECDEQVGGCGKLLTASEYDAYTAVLAGQHAA